MSQKPPVTQKMIQSALDDQAITLFAQQEPLYFKNALKERWYFLFTKLIEIPGQSQDIPIHLGIHLIGADGGFLNHHLFYGWNMVISDEGNNSVLVRSMIMRRTFGLGYALKDNVALRTEMGFDDHNSEEFWDKAFRDQKNHQAFIQMVSSHPPAPYERVPSHLSYAGRGVGFNHMVSDMNRAWRAWHEWLVSASILRIW